MGGAVLVPGTLDKYQAKQLAGERFYEAKFDRLAGAGGKITAAQLKAAAARVFILHGSWPRAGRCST